MKRRSRSIMAAAAAAAALPLAASGPPVVRGSRSDVGTGDARAGAKMRRDGRPRRPAVRDDGQREKIREWHARRLEELLDPSSSAFSDLHSSHAQPPPLSQRPQHAQSRHERRRRLYSPGVHGKKSSENNDYGVNLNHVVHAPDLGFQHPQQQQQQHGPINNLLQRPTPRPTQRPTPRPTPRATRRPTPRPTPRATRRPTPGPTERPAPRATAPPPQNDGGMVANSAAFSGGKGGNLFYPLYTPEFTVGTCSDNGNEPSQFHEGSRSSKFLFDALEECCWEWYVDVVGCEFGFAYPVDGELLTRNWVTGDRLPGTDDGGGGNVIEVDDLVMMPYGEAANAVEYKEPPRMATNVASGFASSNSNSNGNNNSNEGKVVVDGPVILPYGTAGDAASNFASGFVNSNNNNNGNMVANNGGGGGGHPYYPHFDVRAYPDGACLNDGHEPGDYSMNPSKYLFDDVEDCCEEWFLSVSLCRAATMGEMSEAVPSPTPWPTPFDDEDILLDTPWPTWDDNDYAGVDGIVTDGDDYDSNQASVPALGGHLFFESFESGDFDTYDWSLRTHPARVDKWEADQTAMAYDGRYAARPGILSTHGSQSNLTISLEGMEVSRGGLLTFAIHALVEMPVDVLHFCINHETIRTFDKIVGSGDMGEWAEVSVVLLPGEHTLTWSYQYFGMPNVNHPQFGSYRMDPRRVGNSWVDAIALSAFTGDEAVSDDGSDAIALATHSRYNGGSAPWALVRDFNAFLGSHCYIAYTGDIFANQGFAEMTWTVVAGPDGGILSFAAFASLYAPHDTLEFTVNGVPEVVMTKPSQNWEQKYVEIDPGRHVLKWRLVKNPPGLAQNILNEVGLPEEYQGYVKVDAIMYRDNVVHYEAAATKPTTTSTTRATTRATTTKKATTTTTTTPKTTTTTTTTTTTSTSTTTTPTTTEEPTTTTKATTTSTTKTTTTTEPKTTTTTTTTVPPPPPVAVLKPAEDCPPGLLPVEGLPGCCLEEASYLGDGACDPWAPYNTEECAFDLGDCCRETCNPDTFYGCDTKEGNAEEMGPFGFFCLDPRHGIIDEVGCDVENREWVGDGGCDAEGGYNTEACGWDMGDCCEGTCDAEHSFYPCGANQPYTCLNPNAGKTSSDPTGSSVKEEDPKDSPYYFHDGFEANVFHPLRWRWMGIGDAKWDTVEQVPEAPAAEGRFYAEARTEYIIDDQGTSILELNVDSPDGGTLSFQIQALIKAPFDDVVIEVDGSPTGVIMQAIEGWDAQSLDVPPGQHAVRWVHRKNPMDASEEQLAASERNAGITRIDDVTFLPH